MPRKGPAPRRPLAVDPVYGSPVVTQLVNRVLLDGKKSTAERIVYGALEGVRSKTDQDPVSVLKRALDNIRPALEVRSRRVGPWWRQQWQKEPPKSGQVSEQARSCRYR